MKLENLTIKQLQDDFYSIALKYDGIEIQFEDEGKNLSFLSNIEELIYYLKGKIKVSTNY